MFDTDYNTLLNSPEWKEKRLEILDRDNHTCCRCGLNAKEKHFEPLVIDIPNTFTVNQIIKNDNRSSKIIEIQEDNDSFFVKTNIDDLDNLMDKDFILVINRVYKSHIKYPFNGSTENEFSSLLYNPLFNNEVLYKALYSLYKKYFPNNVEIDKEGIFLINKNEFYLFKKSTSLHVHHKCYRDGQEIWEQPNYEYITLCNVCHAVVHSSQSIPFYNRYNEILKYLKSCPRCLGQRYFNKYRHVENGICFKCRGVGSI